MQGKVYANKENRIQSIDLRTFFYLLALGIYMVFFILTISFYSNTTFEYGTQLMKFSLILLVTSEFTDFHYKQSDLIGIIFIAFVMLVTYDLVGEIWWRPLLWSAAFAFSARHIEFKKIAKFALWVSIVCLLFIVVSSLIGIIPDYLDKTTHPGVTRHYLGFLYCLYPPTILFNIEALYIYLRKEKITWAELAVCALLCYGIYKLCDARLNFILNLLMIVGIIIVRYRSKLPHFLNKIIIHLSSLLPWMFIICGVISLFFSFGYHSNIAWMSRVNAALGNRLEYGRISYERYGLNAFGQIIEMRGSGLNGSGIREKGRYFYLDCIYVRFLQEYGIILSIILILALTIVMHRIYKKKKHYLLVIMTVLALHAVVDDLILHLYFNTFWIVCIYFLIPEKNKLQKRVDEMKVCLVGSSGGHLTHLYMLKPFWKDKERFWVTFNKEDARSLLKNEKMYPCYFPTNRSIKAFFINLKVAWKVLRKEKPDLIISSGAAVAVPFFYLGKMMGIKTIYIEVFDRVDKPTLTGKLVYPVTDKFIVEWEEMKKVYPKAINLGSIF